MITKTGQGLVKRGSILTAAGAHLAQNAYMKKMIADPESGLLHLLFRSIQKPNSGMGTYAENAAFGAKKALIPELEIMYGKGSEIGLSLQKALSKARAKKGEIFEDLYDKAKFLESPEYREMVRRTFADKAQKAMDFAGDLSQLPLRDKVALLRAARGDFAGALMARTKYGKELVLDYIDKFFPGAGSILAHGPESSMPIGILDRLKGVSTRKLSPEQYRILLSELSSAYKNNEVTGNLAQALSRNRAAKLNKAFEGDDSLGKKLTRWGADSATSAGLAAVDPITASVNAVKRLGDARWVHDYVPLGAEAQGAVGDFFVKTPMKKGFNKGMEGIQYTRSTLPGMVEDIKSVNSVFGPAGAAIVGGRHMRDLADANLLNPFSNQLKHLANSTGLAFHSAGITKEQLEYMRRSFQNFTRSQDRRISDLMRPPAQITPIKLPEPVMGPIGNLLDKRASFTG